MTQLSAIKKYLHNKSTHIKNDTSNKYNVSQLVKYNSLCLVYDRCQVLVIGGVHNSYFPGDFNIHAIALFLPDLPTIAQIVE